jgi:predicted metal-dependent phosphoesterase TrpH
VTTARPDAARVEICDLHTHSTVSDGTCEPAEVVRRAHRVGVSALALTDHDATDGLAEATREASALGVDFLTGIEVSAGAGGVEVHVLGYGFDPRDPALVDLLDGLRAERARRVPRMLDRLRALGVDVEPDAVFRIAGRGSVGRPHVARALVAAGACRSVDQASC